MGSLAGHVLPGCFFLIHGLTWAVLAMWMQLKSRVESSSKKNGKVKHEGSGNHTLASFFEYKRDHSLSRKSWIPAPCCPRIPIEPIIKIVLPLIGIIVEEFFDIRPDHNGDLHLVAIVYNVHQPDGKLSNLAKLHHITMYGGFLLSGIIDVLALFVKFPRQTSMIMFSVAFWAEWMLFYAHSNVHNAVELHIHFILTLVIFSCVIFSAVRIFQAANLLINLGLAFSILLQGSWFIQVGVTLYPPGKHSDVPETEEHGMVMYIYALFTWHVMLLAVSILFMWVMLSCFMRSRINRRLSKIRGGIGKSSQVHNWVDSEENERLITVDETSRREETGIVIEMQEVADTAT